MLLMWSKTITYQDGVKLAQIGNLVLCSCEGEKESLLLYKLNYPS